ncbi:sigma-70 family RNA polymerase sigma factor [Paenibacillus mendelii]|uniref:RNA polymerase sigma factor n=1 Tax=Paenibacillus mendelii TaxID=206163 RepID=A0ABV6JEF2_9BACL|nr:sigma-70 family RNA polymerase sigma factor [Paenibacillus mendelii]MCQ6557169.1 sigma-70 family RNA polymerase sigma factor [Paenibacillus mendelii]
MEISDIELAERAKLGDREAFNELLARQRSRAFSWAKSIVQDEHMAEDVVQEALLSAFLKLGTVADMRRFLPWLRAIVRNQALMKLRRGGPYGKEKPFSSFLAANKQAEPDWGDLDTVLYRITKRANPSQESRHELEMPVTEALTGLIRVLGPRERTVFEQFFYQQLAPDEIAAQFDTNVNNIHKTLSRIRKKLSNEKMELDIRTELRSFFDQAGYKRHMLPKPAIQGEDLVHPDMSYPYAIYHALRSAGKDITLAEVTGFTGYAFIINLRLPMISAASAMLWDWDTFLANGLFTLGYHYRYVDYQHYKIAAPSKHKTEKLLCTLTMLRQSVDSGFPALLNNGLHYEASLVYGYDDQEQLLYVSDSRSTAAIPYSSLYAGRAELDTRISRELYAYVLDGTLASVNPAEQMLRLIQRIIRHAEGQDSTFLPCANGIQAYDEWMKAFELETIDPLGNASCLAIFGWCRQQAAAFWREQSQRWQSEERYAAYPSWGEMFHDAAECYSRVYECYRQLQTLFPFPSGGDPHEYNHKTSAVRLLEQAKQEEWKAIQAFKRFEADHSHASKRVISHIPVNPFYSFGGMRPKDSCPATECQLDSIYVTCTNLKTSIIFYSTLLGLTITPEMLDGPIGVFQLENGPNLILADKRLDLMHVDWRPDLIVRTPDIEFTFVEMKRQQWEIIYALDHGGIDMDFFIAADKDGNQILIVNRAITYSSASIVCHNDDHPIQPELTCFCLAVKDEMASRHAYNLAFPEMVNHNVISFTNKLHRKATDTRIQLSSRNLDAAYRFLREQDTVILHYSDEREDGSISMIIQDPDGLPIVIHGLV